MRRPWRGKLRDKLRKRLRGKAGSKATGGEANPPASGELGALRQENEQLKASVGELTTTVGKLTCENAELVAELVRLRHLWDEADVDEFALLATPRKARGNKGEAQKSQCLAALVEARAAQHAATFFSLQRAELARVLDGARSHLQALEDALAGDTEPHKHPLLAPLRAQVRRLESDVQEAKAKGDNAARRFARLRLDTFHTATARLRATTAELAREFEGLDVGAVATSVKRLRRIHEPLSESDTVELQRNGESDEAARSLRFLQRMYAIGWALWGPLKQRLEGIARDVEGASRGGGGCGGGVEVQMANLQSLERALEKTMEEHDGDFSRLRDTVRASVVCDGVDDVAAVLNRMSVALLGEDGDDEGGESSSQQRDDGGNMLASVRLVRIENRLDPGYDPKAEEDGYRDVVLNVVVGVDLGREEGRSREEGVLQREGSWSGLVFLVCEIRVHLRRFLHLRDAAGAHHGLYRQARSLQLLDKRLDQVFVHGDKESFDAALERMERGACRVFIGDFFPLDLAMGTRLCSALLNRTTCRVEILSLRSASLASVAKVFHGHRVEGLREVVLSDNQGIDGAFVARFISKALCVLEVRECGVGAQGMKAIASRMIEVHGTCLRELDVAKNELGREGVVGLAPALGHLAHLTKLDLSVNALGSDGALVLAPSLKALTRLSDLNLGGNKMGSEGVGQILLSLEALPNLTKLDLSGNGLGGEGAAAIAEQLVMLETLGKLTDLDLSWNSIESEGARAIAPPLGRLTNLGHLSLAGNSLGSEGAQEITPLLIALTNLVNLDLSWNNLGCGGAMFVAPAVAAMTKLTSLNLSNNKLETRGTAAIAQSLKKLTKLIDLDMCRNRLTDADKKLIRDVASQGCSVKVE